MQAGQPSGNGKSAAVQVRKSNLWRDNYNPLRQLTIARVMAILEQAERGAFPELQLTMRKVEKRFPIYKALRQRRLSAIQKLDWDVKMMEEIPAGFTPEQAEVQQKFLKNRYNLITNLREAFGQIALAEFRGYTVLQKHRYTEGQNDGAVEKLYWLEPWCFSRDGFYGDFYYNETSQFSVGLGSCKSVLGESNRIGSETLPRSEFVIREVESPLYEIAIIAFINWLMGRKDQAAFVEIFGLPNAVVIMPPNIPGGKEAEYQAAAEQVADGVSGALPNGSDVKFPGASQRGEDPFEKFCSAQEKDVVLAGTGGLLTMLSMPQGIGAGSTDAHADAFDEIAQADALKISEILQRDFDAVELAAEFPDQPCLAYFELSPKDKTDVAAVVNDVQKLKSAGYTVDCCWLEEKTGYKLAGAAESDEGDETVEDKAAEDDATVPGDKDNDSDDDTTPEGDTDKDFAGKVTNRSASEDASAIAATVQDTLAPILKRLDAIARVEDPGIQQHMLEKLLADFPQIAEAISADQSLAKVIAPQLEAGLLAGLKGNTPA
jgi:phage gp29-like protein